MNKVDIYLILISICVISGMIFILILTSITQNFFYLVGALFIIFLGSIVRKIVINEPSNQYKNLHEIQD